ncbi:MAG: glycosyltransferase family 39 protein [Candidatus Moranbacteria bacterium]|nr:glycosyltransferase family 39 protein [Candidatus Moranbacteria bacterium]
MTNKVPARILVLLTILVVGIFLRTYHFKDWLLVASDQARDLTLVGNVVSGKTSWPLLGPDMSGGEGFKLGPIYYYFQIISAEIFGISAASQAYPDLLFSILSIPLLYYFLKRFFSENAALFSTGIYTSSYFAIEYSRFAWNVNLIPFFVLLFLLSFWEFSIGKEKTPWIWVISAGVSLGVGVQLHAILLLLFPAVVFCGFIFIAKNNARFWHKFAVIMTIALMLNLGQFINEQRTDFGNTKAFLDAFIFKSQRTDGSVMKSFKLDIACNAQASSLAISSLGNKNICDFLYDGERSTTYNSKIHLNMDPALLLGKLSSLLFLILGFGYLTYSFHAESDKKRKTFLGLIVLYAVLYFLVMLPIAPGSRMRYYLPIIFLPFVFLGFLFDFLAKKCPQKHLWIIVGIFSLLMLLNMNSLLAEAATLSSGIKVDFTKI